jgi:hypothetical protein
LKNVLSEGHAPRGAAWRFGDIALNLGPHRPDSRQDGGAAHGRKLRFHHWATERSSACGLLAGISGNLGVGDIGRASFSQSADSPQYVLTTKWRGGEE